MTTDTDEISREDTKLLFWSTPESAAAGRFTVLALLETLAAMSIVLGLVAYTGNWKLVLIPACVAPLLLLRTEASTELGLGILSKVEHLLAERPDPVSVVFVGLLLAPMSTLIKIYSTTRSVFQEGFRSILNVPGNWWRITLATDLHHAPELVPGVELNQPKHGLSYSSLWEDWSSEPLPLKLVKPGITIICFLPALFYRWSLKSTALLYLPLLWAMQPLFPPTLSVVQRLKLFANSDRVLITTIFSGGSALLFVMKLWLMTTWNGFAESVNSTDFGQTLGTFIEPALIPRWQLGMFINSCLMLAVFFYVRRWIQRHKVGAPVSERTAANVMTWATVFRRILTGYTMACTFYITARLAMDWNLPPLGDQWFPWQ